MSRATAGGLLAVLIAAAGACGGDGGGDAWSGRIDTLPGGALLVSNPAEGLWDSAAAWRLEEELRIGAAMGEGPEVFGEILDVEVDAAGRIYVLDAQAQEVRVFGPDGAFVGTVGRPGGGPGELRGANGIAIDPLGRLWVADPRSVRYTVFDTTGALVATYRWPMSCWGYTWPGTITASGELWDEGCLVSGEARAQLSPGEPSFFVARYDTTRRDMVDTLILPPSGLEPQVVTFEGADGSRTMMQIPFAPRGHRVLDPRGFVWTGTSDAYHIHKLALDGDTVLTLERAGDPAPVTAAERDSVLAPIRRRGGSVDASRIPSHKPFFDGLIADDRGHLWVRRPHRDAEPGLAFDVFDPRGRYLGAVTVPVRTRFWLPIRIRGSTLYAVDLGELDVPAVVRFRIVGRD